MLPHLLRRRSADSHIPPHNSHTFAPPSDQSREQSYRVAAHPRTAATPASEEPDAAEGNGEKTVRKGVCVRDSDCGQPGEKRKCEEVVDEHVKEKLKRY
jgi:hypothetical protein